MLQQFLVDRDERTFAAIVKRHGGMVMEVCRSVLHHQQDAEDVFQATFLVLARKADSIRNRQSLGSWLHGVGYRLALKMRDQAGGRRDREPIVHEPGKTDGFDDLTMRELRAIVHEELDRLTEGYRTALLLCYWEGKTRDEAAALLGITADAFKKCLERARRLLGSRLVQRGLAPASAFFAALFTTGAVDASVPFILTKTTAEAASAFAAGEISTGASASAVAMAEGVIQTMNITKWISSLVIALLLGAVGVALGYAGYQTFGNDAMGAELAPVTLGPPAIVQANGKTSPKSDREPIAGIWRIASGVAEGKPMPAEFIQFARLQFHADGKFAMTVLEESKPGRYKLVGPGRIDLKSDINENDLSQGIFKFDGADSLTICFSNGKDARPTEFAAGEGSAQVLMHLARAKPGEEKPKVDLKDLDAVREAANRAISANNLKQIALAMHNYEAVYKHFPRHAIYSKDGKKPLLSWRVEILPFIDQDQLYKQFKLDEPWDSPHNIKLVEKMPKTFAAPGTAGKAKRGETNYQVITGPDTMFDGPKKMRFQDITDGTSNTLMAVEASNPVAWTRPDDLTMPKDKDKLPAVGGLFSNGFHIMLCDGSVRLLPLRPDVATFRALVTPAAAD